VTGPKLLELGRVARQTVELDTDRWFKRADLADAYVQCAADQLDQGSYTHCLQLLRRAGEVCPSYSALHTALHNPTRDPRGES
jgi:hypothetical protein